jgi:hypothetical protein
MKQYYKGNVEVLKVKNLTINKNTPNIVQKRLVVNRDVLFYKTRLGVIIRFEDKCPIPTYHEVLDYMSKYLNGESEPGTYTSGTYVAVDSLKPIEISKEEEKKLIKERKLQKKLQRKTSSKN